jgi:hypothetical protein
MVSSHEPENLYFDKSPYITKNYLVNAI